MIGHKQQELKQQEAELKRSVVASKPVLASCSLFTRALCPIRMTKEHNDMKKEFTRLNNRMREPNTDKNKDLRKRRKECVLCSVPCSCWPLPSNAGCR